MRSPHDDPSIPPARTGGIPFTSVKELSRFVPNRTCGCTRHRLRSAWAPEVRIAGPCPLALGRDEFDAVDRPQRIVAAVGEFEAEIVRAGDHGP